MTEDFGVNFERQFVDVDETRNSIVVPGPNSAATSDPDVAAIEENGENYV